MELETVKKIQIERLLNMQDLGKQTRNTNISITNRMSETEEIILIIEDTV